MENIKSNRRPKQKIRARDGRVGPHAWLDIQFHDTVDPQKHNYFSRFLQRHSTGDEPDVITLQDVKDVALFQVLTTLPLDFIDMFHTQEVDKFLWIFIFYFQCYLQVHSEMINRLIILKEKLRSLESSIYEEKLGRCLSELRALVGRNYGGLLVGLGGTRRHHHMANKLRTSDTEKDLRLYELLYRMCIRVVWIALGRQYLSIIETEGNRLFRTRSFCEDGTSRNNFLQFLKRNPDYRRVLLGEGTKVKSKLLAKSPAIDELINSSCTLQFCSLSVQNARHDQKMKITLAAQFTTEEDLSSLGLAIGILGMPRKQFDAMLVPIVPIEDETIPRYSAVRRISLHKEAIQCIDFDLSKFGQTVTVKPKMFFSVDSELVKSRREASKVLWTNYMKKRMKTQML